MHSPRQPEPRRFAVLLLCAMFPFLLGAATGQGQAPLEKLGGFKARGLADAQLVGPGPTPGSERLYATYTYPGSTFDLVAVDPATGECQVFPGPISGEPGAKGLVLAQDGNLYLGTYPKGHILRFAPRTGRFTDLGRPAPRDPECWIWEMVEAPDHRIYMATSPSAKLLRFDPGSGRMEDLGRMDPSENYCRYIAASRDGFIYLGIGLGKSQLVAYEIATGIHRPILPASYRTPSTAVKVRLGADGQIYASVAGRYLRVKGWDAEPIPATEQRDPEPQNHWEGNKSVSVDLAGRLTRSTSAAPASAPARAPATPAHPGPERNSILAYQGKAQPPFRLTFGPDGNLYGSSAYPAYLFRMSPERREMTNLGLIGPGEAYQLMPYKDRLALAVYAGFGGFNLMLFDPSKPFDMVFDPDKPYQAGMTRALNPLGVNLANSMGNWRPKAMIQGPDGKIYIGAVPGYGLLGGSLLAWDAEANTLKTHLISPNLSIVSLCTTRGLIIGGTSREGGSGSRTTGKDATLFVWNPQTGKMVYEVAPVLGQPLVTNLTATPEGLVYGIAGAHDVFKFDTRSRVITRLGSLPCNCNIYSSSALGPDGNVYGLAEEGIYTIDTRKDAAHMLVASPDKITAGFALRKGYLYFACGTNIYRYTIRPR